MIDNKRKHPMILMVETSFCLQKNKTCPIYISKKKKFQISNNI